MHLTSSQNAPLGKNIAPVHARRRRRALTAGRHWGKWTLRRETVSGGLVDPDGDGKRFTYNHRFPGQYWDKETALHYNYYRDGYDPSIGRYTQSDPIGLSGGINTYSYVNGNPVSFVDPLGLVKDTITARIESAIIRGDTKALQGFVDGGGLSHAQQIAAQQGIRAIEILSKSTSSVSEIASTFGRSSRQIKDAIHACKRNMSREGPERNPDVIVDKITGEVYPKLSSGKIGDSIGNIFDHLP